MVKKITALVLFIFVATGSLSLPQEIEAIPLGEEGYIIYDPNAYKEPDAVRYEALIRLVKSTFAQPDILPKVRIFHLSFEDYENKIKSVFGSRWYKNRIERAGFIYGFVDPSTTEQDMVDVYVHRLEDKVIVHELLHVFLYRIAPSDLLGGVPGSQPLLNYEKIVRSVTSVIMVSSVYKNWRREFN